MERKDVTVNLGTARAVAGAGHGGTPPTGDAEAGGGHLDASEEAVSGSGAAKYRKKPVVIEAMVYTGTNGSEVLDWLEAGGEPDAFPHADNIVIPTLEGDHAAQPGDYVIRGVQGEFYPCKPHIFEATYEPA